MKTLAITNQKGGVGKTTLVINLAQFASIKHHKKVAVIDLDTQANASWTLAEYSVANTGDIFFGNNASVKADKDLNLIAADYRLANIDKANVEELANRLENVKKQLEEQGVDFFIIDTPPSMSNALVSALLVTDYVLCPIELETFSLQGVKKMRTVIGKVKTRNTTLTEIGLLPSRVNHINRIQKKQLEEMQREFPELVCPCSIGLRSSIAESVSSRTWIGMNKSSGARKAIMEFSALTNWVLQKIELA